MDGSTTMQNWAVPTGLSRLAREKRDIKLGGGCAGGELEEKMGGAMVVFYCILYEILKYIEKNLFCLQFGVPVISVLPALRGFL